MISGNRDDSDGYMEVNAVGKEIKKELLNLLEEDEEVISVVRRILVSDNRMEAHTEEQKSEYVKQIERLKSERDSIIQQKVLLESELKQKDEEIRGIQNKYLEYKMQKDHETEKYSDLILKYAELDSFFKKYLGLGEPIIKRMERILNQSSQISAKPEIFMAYGMQENNIIALWESIAMNYDFYDSYGKTDDLIDIFQFFLGLYKEISFKNIKIECPDIGDMYDERKHTRTSSSNAVGIIQKVILPGFSIGKNITKKSLVIVK